MAQQPESDDIVTLLLHGGWLAFTNLLIGVCLASRLPRWSLYLSFAFIASGCLFASFCRTGQATVDYTLGSVLGSCIFNAFHLLVLAEPAKQYRHKLDDPQTGPNNLPWVKRVYWGCCASAAVRGVGWNFQAPHIPKPPRMGRVRFLFHAVNQLLFYFLIHDLAQTLSRTVPYLHHDSHDFSIRSLPYTKRALCTVTWLVGACSGIQLCYYSIVLFWVGTGWYSSEECPPLFGDLMETYSVRNFWGKTWHQFVRRFALAPGKKLVQVLGLPPKSSPAALLELYIAFLVSGTVHFLGDLMVRRPEYYGVSILFFTLQAVGITIEELAKFFIRQYARGWWDRTLPAWVGRGVGYAWVLCWLTLTMPVLIDPATQVGFDKESLIPLSPVRILFSLYLPPTLL